MDIQEFGAALLAKLDALRQDVQGLRPEKPEQRPEGRVAFFVLSSVASNPVQNIPYDGRIVGLIINDSSTGRGLLNLDNNPLPFYTVAYAPQFYPFGDVGPAIKGARVTWTPPGSGDTWDIIFMIGIGGA